MAGSAVFSEKLSNDGKSVELKWVCTSDGAAGNVSAPTITQPGSTTNFKHNSPFTGVFGPVTIEPSGGATAPTTGFDVKLQDAENTLIDYLGADGMNQVVPATEIKPFTPVDQVTGIAVGLLARRLLPYAENCGNAKVFTLRVNLNL